MTAARNAKRPARTGGATPVRDPRLPAPGTVLRRTCKGQTLEVRVLAEGFQWRGQHYGSLSAVATQAYGCPCNGYLFFNLLPKPATAAAPSIPPAEPPAPTRRRAGRPIAPRRA